MATAHNLFEAFVGNLPQASPHFHTHVLNGYRHVSTTRHATKQAAEMARRSSPNCIVTSPSEHRLWFLSKGGPVLVSEHPTIEKALAAQHHINVQTIVTSPEASLAGAQGPIARLP
ncbi:hypothetical protein [Nereida ignava]|uniref:hypothetical protein n=1 Tax=Nereida ignava TaxID=282199 RepID=UPI0030FAB856